MARRRVIAYPMHEEEMGKVGSAIDAVEVTEAFQVGYLDDADVDRLRDQGIVVELLDEAVPGSESASVARRSLGLDTQTIAIDEPPTPQPGDEVNWRVTLDRPLGEQLRDAISSADGTVLEAIGRFRYIVVGTTATADALVATPGVVDVERHAGDFAAPLPLRTAPPLELGVPPSDLAAAPPSWDIVTAGEKWTERTAASLDDAGQRYERISTRVIRFEADPSDDVLGRVPHLPGVVSVVEHVEPDLQVDHARPLIGLPLTGAGNSPLDGSGQVIAVADTGIDEQHPDLAGQILGSRAYGRPTLGGGAGDVSDPDGHGTHVAGTIAGNGAASGGVLNGVAPGARLWFQSLYGGPAAPLSGLPADTAELLDDAYAQGARVHNDSWGAFVKGAYDTRAVQIDEFVDLHPDMVVVIAAGNAGNAARPVIAPPGYPDHYSVTSPATAKNAISVGASRSDRATVVTHRQRWPLEFPDPPTADELIAGDPERLAGFSSRGPCDDERIKPDVVAPGTCIMSVRSSRAPDTAFEALGPGGRYGMMSGTSMAAPIVSGAAAIVRQYFVAAGHEPSAALVKATLIAGARWLDGPDAMIEGRGVPNPDQGFGRIDLAGSLPNGERRLAFIDTWTGVHAGFAFDRTGLRRRFEVEVARPGPLVFVLAWTDRPGRSVQQDLGLFAEVPGGTKRIGNENRANRAFETDLVNTVEIIRIDDASMGSHLANVIARSLAFVDRPQHWALVAIGGFDGDFVPRGIY